MTLLGIAQIVIFFAIVVAITKPIGIFMHRVFEGERTFLHPIFRPLERLIYWLGGVREDEEQSWIRYSASMISLSIFSFLFVYALQRLQGYLPLNPMHFSTPQAPQNATAMTPDLAFNTAVSFMTNTNWQAYSPDTTMSYLTQMASSRSPELCFRRCWHSCGGCANSWVCASYREDDRKFLGRRNSLHALHPASHLYPIDAVLRMARIDPKLQRARHGNDSGRTDPGD